LDTSEEIAVPGSEGSSRVVEYAVPYQCGMDCVLYMICDVSFDGEDCNFETSCFGVFLKCGLVYVV
jgi:hypothetical protein